jgi:tetratricopeptide (TPR) repeat protein
MRIVFFAWIVSVALSESTELEAGNRALSEGDLLSAMKHYESAVRSGHGFEALFNLATATHLSGNAQSALELYKKSAVLKPKFPQLHFNMAKARQGNADVCRLTLQSSAMSRARYAILKLQ